MDFKNSRYGRFMNGRVPSSRRYQPTDYEHAANCATHGLWIIPSLVGGSVLYFLSVDQWQAAAAWLYGAGLSGLFISSTLFHTVAWKIRHLSRVEQRFHMCDRMAIYFFIAASYTPWYKLLELLGYVAMGAGPALVILSMADRAGLCELAVGGIFYVVGVAFFKSDGVVPFAHAIWHLFVAMGAATHYYAIWRHLYTPGH
ncbi:monocyte to macrophage differentiation factor 2-like isoform X5 [Oncorhynchus tshawytscha]|uniref:monocyte to macrophage differentiation factor 2-like isoform X5 n=1 Tax=Oncorhynchus tshawytscha TaxID=74940 RepID=UPI001C3DBE76|nr:monocyte to macrophage differentiation factor 2-like isoform X5 [Oncorhynchus tshawytscha]